MDGNPYAPPSSTPDPEPGTLLDSVPAGASEAEFIRLAHIGRESSIKTIAVLYLLSALTNLPSVISVLAGGMGEMNKSDLLVLTSFCILSFGIFFGLRKLRPWGRWLAVIFTVLVLFDRISTGLNNVLNYIGLLMPVFIASLMLAPKSVVVFSPAYKDIIAATPQIRYRPPMWLKIGLIGLIVFVVIGFFMPSA